MATNHHDFNETIAQLRRKMKHRLLGGFVLLLVAISTFWGVLASQPRSIPSDLTVHMPEKLNEFTPVSNQNPIPIKIPIENKSQDDLLSAEKFKPSKQNIQTSNTNHTIANTNTRKQSSPTPIATTQLQNKASLAPNEEIVQSQTTNTISTDITPEQVDTTNEVTNELKKIATRENINTTTADAKKYIVQIGTFSDAKKAQVVRLQVEKMGLKTYTQIKNTPEAALTRVRIGPFLKKEHADSILLKITKSKLKLSSTPAIFSI